MLAQDVLALLDAGSGSEAAQPGCSSPSCLQASLNMLCITCAA